jgi:PilZ domain
MAHTVGRSEYSPSMRGEDGTNPRHDVMGEPNPDNRRRSRRVLIQVAVLVKVEMPGGKHGQAQAFTLSVNAHGGLLEGTMRMNTGQKITLVNPRTKKEVSCRVVRVDGSSESSFTIAFEFDQPTPRFWPLTFPPENWGVRGNSGC